MSDLVKGGDTVTCIEGRDNLTVGKQYLVHRTVEDNNGYFYFVTGDNGVPHCKYYGHRFKLYQSSGITEDAAEEYDEAMLAQTIMDDLHG